MKQDIVLYTSLPNDLKIRLDEIFNVISFEQISSSNYKDVKLALKNAVGMIGANANITANLLEYATKLKVIATISVGYDNFDLEYLNTNKILLMNTPDVLTDTNADNIFNLILSTARRTVEMNEYIKLGKWIGPLKPEYLGVDIHHQTIGILGMGRIGQAVAKRAYCGFDMNVLYTSNSRKIYAEEKYLAKHCDLDELLAKSDFVCITLPYTSKTDKLINQERLSLMKPSAILINGGRGKIVDEKALITALQQGKIKAAGLDVFEVEPLEVNSHLLQMPNVVALPHIGSFTHKTQYKMKECAVDNLINGLMGKPSKNMVNPQRY